MSFHKTPKYQVPELIQALKDHGLEHNRPSQLADAFRTGWVAAIAQAALTRPQAAAAGVTDAEIPPLPWKARNIGGICEIVDANNEVVVKWMGFDDGRKTFKARKALTRFIADAASRSPAPAGVAGGVDAGKVPKGVLLAITNAGLTLLKTQHGYELRKLGPVIAQAQPSTHSAVGGSGGEQKPLSETEVDKLWTKLMCGQGSGDILDFVRDIEAAHGIGTAPEQGRAVDVGAGK